MSMFSKKNKKAKEVVEEEVVVQETESVTRRNSHKEHVFGAFLFGGLMLVVLAGLGGIGFGTYNLWQIKSAENIAPSISTLATTEVTTEEPEAKTEETKEAKEVVSGSDSESLKKAQAVDVIVMNGGGAKGVASAAANKLKEAGFSKVTIGNTTGDFTGTTVYAKKDLEKEASEVVTKLKTDYPTIAFKEALLSDKETQTAPITIIFGK